METEKYFYGIPEAGLKRNLEKWLKNPAWREYYETAPSDRCRLLISVEFWESEHESDAAAEAAANLEKGLSLEDWKHLYRYCGNNPRKKYIHDRIMDLERNDQPEPQTDIRKNPDHYPCHLYGIENAKEAFKAQDTEYLKDYGARLVLEDGTVLHDNYPLHHDDGARFLERCKVCGCLMLTQRSMEDCPYWDDPDLYYRDSIPVATVEEADLLNILWDEKELKNNSFRHLQRDDMSRRWTEGKDPSPYDPEELKEMIRKKYSRLGNKRREMLEKLICEAGKKTKDA